MNETTTNHDYSATVYFDGYCNLCNSWVNFLLRIDKRHRLTFATLTSSAAKSIAAELTGAAAVPDSVIFADNGVVYFKSAAVLRILRHLGGPWLIVYVLIIVPRPIRDVFYNFVARNRYRWFGKRQDCRVPTAEERARFHD